MRRAVQAVWFVALLALVTLAPAQPDPGFVLAGSTTALTLTDSAVTDGATYEYEVTATNAAGESGPSNVTAGVTIPATGTHSVTLTWSASSGATGYNVYRFLVQVPPAPAGLKAVVN